MSAARASQSGRSRGTRLGWQGGLRSLAGRLQFVRRRLRLGRVAGVEVNVNYSWPIFPLVTFALTITYLPTSLISLGPAVLAPLALVAALLLLGSLLVHELGHTLVARARGLKVNGITLFFLGGYTELDGELDDPIDELLIFLAGPLCSIAVAGSFFTLSRLPIAQSPVFAILPSLATVNLIIAAVNLVPGLPLDGGRVLRAVVRSATGSPNAATYWASIVGQVFAVVLVVLAGVQLANGSFLGGAWNLFIAWFLNGAALSSRRAPQVAVVYAGAAGDAIPTAILPSDVPVVVRVDEDHRLEA